MQTELLHPYASPTPLVHPPHQPYLQHLIEAFNFLLSPQQLPYNMAARQYMDEELWMPIQILAKLPQLDSLYITDLMFPFVTDMLCRYSSDTLEVDVMRGMVRPRWALRSSVFLTNVDLNATGEQVFSLLDDIRQAVTCYNNPFEYCNVTITKQAPTSWTICFNSPSAGPYAAMAMKTKCINGNMILPMACVHLNPPPACYSSAGIVVLEVDALQYGDPVVPSNLVPFYSENYDHLNFLYITAIMQYPGPYYEPTAHFNGFAPMYFPVQHYDSSFYGTGAVANGKAGYTESMDATHSPIEKNRHGDGQQRDPGSEIQTPSTSEHSEDGSSNGDEIKTDARADMANSKLSKEVKLPTPIPDQHPPSNLDRTEAVPHDGHEGITETCAKVDHTPRLVQSFRNNCIPEESGVSDNQSKDESEKAEDTAGKQERVDPTPTSHIDWDECEELSSFPPPKLESIRLPSFLPQIDIGKPALPPQGDARKPQGEIVLQGRATAKESQESSKTQVDIPVSTREKAETVKVSDGSSKPHVDLTVSTRTAKAETVKVSDGSSKPNIDIPAATEAQKERQSTQQARPYQGANKIGDQRSHARQKVSQHNGKHQSFRTSRSVPVQPRNRNDSSGGSSPRRQNIHRMNNAKDSRNGEFRGSHSWSHPGRSGNDGDRTVRRRTHSAEHNEWQVISYKKRPQRRYTRRVSPGSDGSSGNGGRSDRRGKRSPTNSVA